MPHYLSYIEINGHASLMLFEKAHNAEKAKVLYEVGFGYAPSVNDNSVGYFTQHKGHVREETNMSRLLYSRATAKHKTFEISNEEVEKLFLIINRDRRVNLTNVEVNDATEEGFKRFEVVGGPDYQQITKNCKLYAINVMKEIGIIEAAQLSNFFIEIPGTINKKLKILDKSKALCPKKDD